MCNPRVSPFLERSIELPASRLRGGSVPGPSESGCLDRRGPKTGYNPARPLRSEENALAKSRFAAHLTGDNRRLAELAEAEGDLTKAARYRARAGQFSEALRLAVRAGSAARAIHYAFKAALGEDSAVPNGATARQAGDVLRAAGLLDEALLVFELGSAYGPAAETATKLRRPLEAAELYEKAGDWARAAVYFEAEGRLADAVRMLGLRSRQLQQEIDERRQAGAIQEKREIDDRRATLLSQLGRGSEARRAIEGQRATPQSAELHERAGRWQEAFEAHLAMGDEEAAGRLASRVENLPPAQRAALLARAGRHTEAAAALADAGRFDEAARLLEEHNLWSESAQIRERGEDWRGAGTAHRRAGNFEAAARCFKRAGEPGLAADAYSRLGRHSDAVSLHLQAGDLAAAARASERNHHFAEAARYYVQAGDREAAIEALGKVSPGADDWVASTMKLVPMLLEAGRASQALDRVRRISDDPHEVGEAALDRLYWEGRALEAMDRGADAADAYTRLTHLDPGHRDAARRLERSSQPPPRATLERGGRLADRYRIESEIGRGGMGRVYRAIDEELDEPIALKVLLHLERQDSEAESRLLREVQICRRITHPNIVRVFDLGRFDRGLFVTMELLEGTDLATRLEDRGPLSLAECRRILTDVLSGLEEAHAQGVIHRDLKPHNLFLTTERTKILDFGIAHGRSFDTRLTRTGQAVGTPAYMAPEQLMSRQIDERTDLYSLGAVLYEMLTGRGPFEADNPTALALAHVQEAPRNVRDGREGLPESWGRFVHRLLAKEPELRLPSVSHALNVVHALPTDG